MIGAMYIYPQAATLYVSFQHRMNCHYHTIFQLGYIKLYSKAHTLTASVQDEHNVWELGASELCMVSR